MLITTTVLHPLEVLLQILINNYLLESYCVTVITETKLIFRPPSNVTFMYIHAEINITNLILDASEHGCSDFIVQTSEPENFMAAFETVNHLGDIRRSNKKLIFLPLHDETFNASVLMNILTLKMTGFIANILLVVPSEKCPEYCNYYDLVTHNFVGPDAEVDDPLYLDRWDFGLEQFDKGVNLFPHDMSNMNGKTVKVAAFTYKPYVLLDLDPSDNVLGRDGMELRIIDEFCRWVNCTVEIVRDDENQWGEIYDNLTGVGILGNVIEDRADMGITALYSWYEEYRVMDFSASIIRTAITCIAPAARVLSSWDLPFLPFAWLTWVCLIITFFYASFALFVAQRSTDKIFLSTFGMMLTQTRDDLGNSWRIRSITGWMLVTGLIIDNAYGGGLASSFTVPKYEASIDTVQDIVDRKMEWGATHDAWIFSIILSEEPLIKKLLSQFRTYPAEELKRRSFTRSTAFSVEHLPAGTFAIGEYITKEATEDLELMLENFYYEQCVVMLRKSSPYTAKLSELVGRLHQSGLMLAWETQVALKYLDFKVQLEVKLSRSRRDVDEVNPLSLKQVVGIFIIYFSGLSVAFFCFMVEILTKCKKAVVVI
ncbi:glutamate receptor ionotropic, delta-2-like isoform X2 [Choristoneura fumiferana]|uniref:glutamate receptor ionotropic, delta-2-like isoform X2 n=1 Tax=Choristoneura fumiferana TaxID=7141 RepID=UPI003D15DB7C